MAEAMGAAAEPHGTGTTSAHGPPMPESRRSSATMAFLALVSGVSLAGCGGGGGATALGGILGSAQKPCPGAVVVADAKHVYDLGPEGTTPRNFRVAGHIAIPVAECKYRDGEIHVELELPLDAERGPLLAEGRLELEFPYFVAVADRFDNILGKENFVATIKLGGDQERSATVEKIEQVIPLGPEQDGGHFIIYVGFQLTPEQVAFNRRHHL